jgi:predicted alpha/beta superfamily hydrolase
MRALGIRHYLLIFILPLCFNAVSGQTEGSLNTTSVSLERTELRLLHSDIVGQDYELLISLPRDYAGSNHSYPVIIITDAYRSFLIYKAIADVFSKPGALIPEVILVGIAYGGDEYNSMLHWAVGRTRDLTPSRDNNAESWLEKTLVTMGFPDADIQTGGAELFLDFIRHELFPYINIHYKADMENKTLCGQSYGGLFRLYTLFHAPETFDRYLIASPSIGYGAGLTYEYESEYANSHNDLNALVFMSSGSLEKTTMENVIRMENLLLSRNYQNLKLRTVIFENESHTSCVPAAISRGLIELFKND